MIDSKYIGRGEVLVKNILLKLFKCEIKQQVNIRMVVNHMDYDMLDSEIKKHNFDLVMYPTHGRPVVIEVNYKHKEKIAIKLRRVIVPLVRKRGFDYLEINDYDCRKRGVFWLNSNKEHCLHTWDDVRDIIDALETAKINPEIF